MADHISEQIMIQVGTLLTGLTTTGARVRRSRQFSVEGINGLTYEMGAEEPLDGEQTINRVYMSLNVIVKAFTKSTDPEIELNQIKKEVIIALKADYTLAGIAVDINENGWSEPDTTGDAEKPVSMTVGVFEVKYVRSRLDPSILA